VPANRVLHEPARWQQLAVMATFAMAKPRRYPPDRLHEQRTRHRPPSRRVAHRVCAKRRVVAIPVRYLEELIPCGLLTLTQARLQMVHPPENNYVDKHIFAS